MTQAEYIDKTVLDPALRLLPSGMGSPQARAMLLAICGQEADFTHRWQVVDPSRPEIRGPARGLFQFERGGGVKGVLTHPATKALAARVCAEHGIRAEVGAVHLALESDDILAACFARLLLWSDPSPLPAIGAKSSAFDLYLRTWRPGAYTRGNRAGRLRLRKKWDEYYDQAVAAIASKADFSNVESGSSSTEDPIPRGDDHD